MRERRPIRVLIADDNRTFRKGMRLQLEHAAGVTVVGETGNGADAVTLARAERADVVLMDIEMPQLDGISATRALTEGGAGRSIGVIVLTSHSSQDHVLRAIEAGAAGYLLKSHDTDQLVPAIQAAARGEALVSTRVAGPVLREVARHRPSATDVQALRRLTQAELRVIALLAAGVTANDEIAEHLHVSVNTVRSQVQSASRKVGAADRTQLALWGARVRVTDPDLHPNG